MPIIKDFSFKPSLLLRNKHFNTIYRHFVAKSEVSYQRERIQTQDNDFLDLDISSVESKKLIIAIHGLEGSSNSNYIRTLVARANKNKFDVIVLNLRGCSGEANNKLNAYHSGKTEDLQDVITHINQKYTYEEINIVAYSLGGNLTLKYMGEFVGELPKNIKCAITISVPCHLKGSALELDKGFNKAYQYRFIRSLKKKVRIKFLQFPKHKLNEEKILKSNNFKSFDNYFTASANGFTDADDYWNKSSSKQFLKYINKPVLLISSTDDPFLSESCFPYKEADSSLHFHFLQTKYGGHVGFYQKLNPKKNFWLEDRILSFIEESK